MCDNELTAQLSFSPWGAGALAEPLHGLLNGLLVALCLQLGRKVAEPLVLGGMVGLGRCLTGHTGIYHTPESTVLDILKLTVHRSTPRDT
jgi:hypothetical protein